MKSEIWKIFISLGVPGLALGIFYMLFKSFRWDFPKVHKNWVGPLVVLFMVLTFSVVFYTLSLWAPVNNSSGSKTSVINNTYNNYYGDFSADKNQTITSSFPCPNGEINRNGRVNKTEELLFIGIKKAKTSEAFSAEVNFTDPEGDAIDIYLCFGPPQLQLNVTKKKGHAKGGLSWEKPLKGYYPISMLVCEEWGLCNETVALILIE